MGEESSALQSNFRFIAELFTFEVRRNPGGFSCHVDDPKVVEGALHFIEFGNIEFFAGIQGARSRTSIFVDGHGLGVPFGFTDVVGDIGVVGGD